MRGREGYGLDFCVSMKGIGWSGSGRRGLSFEIVSNRIIGKETSNHWCAGLQRIAGSET